ncbi:uncharacterized protein [Miscanthus floridulus]|uniref:uncharacterized protein isoform X2 n=1 Tax=Miscanthus floridulus TaxID=154761 RepID=UPI00345A6F42
MIGSVICDLHRQSDRKSAQAIGSSLYHHHSSTMAMISPKLGTRKAEGGSLQVFEDQLRGMVCYRDEKGEMICEVYDEGPRLGTPLPEKACFPWPVGVQVTDFIQLAMLPVFEDADVLQQLKGDQKSLL